MTQFSATISILVLAMDDPSAKDSIEALARKIQQKANLKYVTATQEALNLIGGDTSINAIFVVDASLTLKKYKAVSDEVLRFVQNGGTVVLGGFFSSFVQPKSLNSYFSKVWGLPWKTGDYHRTTVSWNPNAKLPKPHNALLPVSLLPAYSQKAVFLANVDITSAWYLPTENSVTDSLVFPSQPVSNIRETPVAFAKSGNGWLGYVGDVNSEHGSDYVVMAMLGLL